MKRLVLTLLVCILSISIALAIDYPKLTFIGKRIVDLGTVSEGDVVRKNFIIKNEGDVPLIIKQYGMSCNCTDVKIAKDTIQPRDTTNIFMSVSTEGKIGPTSVSVIIETNTLQQEHVVILKMNVMGQKK